MNNDFPGREADVHAGRFSRAHATHPRNFGIPHRPAAAVLGAGGRLKEGGKVDAILARFPAAVTLQASRGRFLGLLAGSLGFVAALMFMLQHGVISPSGAFKAWLGIAFFGAGALVAVVMLLPGAGSLTLRADGFDRVTLFMTLRTPWQQVGNFGVSELPTRRGGRMRLVGYDDGDLPGDNFSRRTTGRNAALPDTYGLSHEDLARLMNQWRARALARRA